MSGYKNLMSCLETPSEWACIAGALVVRFEKRKERVGCSPHPWIVGFLFELVWGHFGVFCF